MVSEPLNFLLVSPEYLEGLHFSATFGEAEKSKVAKGQNFYQQRSSIKKNDKGQEKN
jgi:hypothetical protein